MKTLKNIITCTLLLTAFLSNASTIGNTCLVEEMSTSENVIEFIDNAIVINMGRALMHMHKNEGKELSNAEEINKKINSKVLKNIELEKKVYEEFPLFKNLDVDEKTEIIKEVATISEERLNFTRCLKNVTIVLLGCAGIGAFSWAAARFWFCAASFAISDLAAIGAEPELVIEAAEIAEAEMTVCQRLVGVRLVAAGICSAAWVSSIIACTF